MGRNKYYVKICQNCKREYRDWHKNSKYCSRDCYFEYKKMDKRKICAWCGKVFQIKRAAFHQIYCDRACYMEAHKDEKKRLEVKEMIENLDSAFSFMYNRCMDCKTAIPIGTLRCTECERRYNERERS